jgi:hypothetical protein
MTPTAARRIAVELWFPDTPAEKALAHLPPLDDGPWIPVELWLPDPPAADAPLPKQTRVRKPTLTHALKEADRAGRQVKGATLEGERITLMFGQPEPMASPPDEGEANPWDKRYAPQ